MRVHAHTQLQSVNRKTCGLGGRLERGSGLFSVYQRSVLNVSARAWCTPLAAKSRLLRHGYLTLSVPASFPFSWFGWLNASQLFLCLAHAGFSFTSCIIWRSFSFITWGRHFKGSFFMKGISIRNWFYVDRWSGSIVSSCWNHRYVEKICAETFTSKPAFLAPELRCTWLFISLYFFFSGKYRSKSITPRILQRNNHGDVHVFTIIIYTFCIKQSWSHLAAFTFDLFFVSFDMTA